MKTAKFKFNSGHAALCCSQCGSIIKVGFEFTDEESDAYRGLIQIPAQYCDECLNLKEEGLVNEKTDY
jgi:hypothetical protein